MTTKKLRLAQRSSRAAYKGIALSSFPIRSLPIADLWQSVSVVPAFVEEIRESIADEGLFQPVIVVRLPREEVVEYFTKKRALRGVSGGGSHVPDRPWLSVIWGGSNRVAAIAELGYTHVDCVLIPEFELASAVQKAQRDHYKRHKAQ